MGLDKSVCGSGWDYLNLQESWYWLNSSCDLVKWDWSESSVGVEGIGLDFMCERALKAVKHSVHYVK